MFVLMTFFTPQPVTHSDLGKLGGNPHFIPPAPDRSQQIQQGQIPTAKQTAVYPWGWSL